MTVLIHEQDFATNQDKAAYMLEQSIGDAGLPEVRRWATVFLRQPPEGRAGAIFRFVQYGIDYVRDPGREVLEDAAVVLLRGYGDCDAKSRLFVALCIACGIPARGLPVRVEEDFPHILAEVHIGGRWLRADPTILNSSIADIPPASHAVTNYWR